MLQCDGVQIKAAARRAYNRNTLHKKLAQYGLSGPRATGGSSAKRQPLRRTGLARVTASLAAHSAGVSLRTCSGIDMRAYGNSGATLTLVVSMFPRAHGHGERGHGSTSVSVFCQKGGSPFQVGALRLVAERNCVAARRAWGVPGGERPVRNASELDSAGCRGEPAAKWRSPDRKREPATLRGSVSKRSQDAPGGWRRNGRKARHMKQRDLSGTRHPRAGVRGAIVAAKPGNAVERRAPGRWMTNDPTRGRTLGESAVGSAS
jgi:hypothetical protein